MKIACGWDHHGRRFRESFKAMLRDMGHEYVDMGAPTDAASDYPDFAFKVADAVSAAQVDRGILVCGTGIGMSMAANKVAGVRAAVVCDPNAARLSRAHNNANVLCLGEQTAETAALREIVETWLTTDFDGGRHAVRVNKIMARDKKETETEHN